MLTVHDVSYLDHPGWYAPGAARYKGLMLAAALAKRPAAILCDSRHTRERLLAHHPWAVELDTLIVHPGLVAPPPDRPRRQVDTAEPYFVTVSTIETRKNHLGLLRAFRVARARGLRLRWKIAGAGGHGCEQVLAALTAAEGVDVLGWVSPAALEPLYAGALFLALPSHEEGFGYPALEAMARDVATVCSTGSALDETVGVAGMRVPAQDTQAWAAALRRLQDDHAERELLVRAGGENARRFAWKAAARPDSPDTPLGILRIDMSGVGSSQSRDIRAGSMDGRIARLRGQESRRLLID